MSITDELVSSAKIALLSIFITSCANLPDVQHAKTVLNEGGNNAALDELEFLSSKGFPDAKLFLADYYLNQNEPAAWKKAESLYNEILDKDHRALLRLGKVYRKYNSLQPNPITFNKSAEYFIKGFENGDNLSLAPLIDLYLTEPEYISSDIPMAQWISIQESQDPELAAISQARLVALNMQTSADARLEVVGLCRSAFATSDDCRLLIGRAWLLSEADAELEGYLEDIKSLLKQGLITHENVFSLAKMILNGAKLENKTIDSLFRLASAEVPAAHIYLMRVYLFQGGVDPTDADVKKLIQLADAGDKSACYLLGRLYFQGQWVVQNPTVAEKYLSEAADEVVGAAYTLGLLYREGWLGRPDFNAALKYLLSAARQGSGSADRELAEIFWVQQGAKQNPVYAYSFAKIASMSGDEKSQILYSEIAASVSVAQRLEAEKLAVRELEKREQILNLAKTNFPLGKVTNLVVQE